MAELAVTAMAGGCSLNESDSNNTLIKNKTKFFSCL
jgi:hypothetical protein